VNTKDFKDFVEGDLKTPPPALSQRVIAVVHRDLSPHAALVFCKLFAVHAGTAIGTLSLCPQFGIRVFGEGPGLMGYFMRFGHLGCMVACGFFFLASSIAVASLVLRPEELRVIRNHRGFELGSLAVLSLGFFFALAPELILEVAIAWLMGAIAGALFALEVGFRIRIRPLKAAS